MAAMNVLRTLHGHVESRLWRRLEALARGPGAGPRASGRLVELVPRVSNPWVRRVPGGPVVAPRRREAAVPAPAVAEPLLSARVRKPFDDI